MISSRAGKLWICAAVLVLAVVVVFTIAVTNLYAEAEHIGRRTTGTAEGYFALVADGWEGVLPAGVASLPVETRQGWLLGRMLVDGPEDFDEAMALVEDIWLSPLSEFTPGRRPPAPPELKYNPDGSLTLLLQHEPPADPSARSVPHPSGLC